MSPFDFVQSVSYNKQDLLAEDAAAIKFYVPYIVNKALSYHVDTLLHANEMNMNAHLDPKLQYRFFLNTIRKARRFSKWAKMETNQDLLAVQRFYKFNTEKAKQALVLLSSEQIQHIRLKIEAGGEYNVNNTQHDRSAA